ncbi:hypothetical protein JTE90_020828 [Oedothorax gibbosus]|uniref:Interference hedgehog n=1 Tax=Oedothorax gibbosus TaxID=931172 RepID=A0AAV6U2D9_9ARAC|nr:hypothetical protein JTE90_020828 [Oedothorax gibbosus]
MRETKHLLLFALVQLFSFFILASSNSHLQFINEPMSRLVKISEGRVVFRCDASPPGSIIRWLHNGHPVMHNRWIKVAGQKLTILLGKMDNVTSTGPSDLPQSDHYFQCEIRFKGKALVSAPAKLIIATVDQFPNQPDVHISAIVGNTAVIPCDPPYSVPAVITEFLFNDTTITRSRGNRHLMDSGDLQIFNVGHHDSGEYTCVANNPFLAEKVVAKKKVILHVVDPLEPRPTTITKSPRSKVSVAFGSNITLECAAAGHPTPTVTWRKHHGRLPHERHQLIGGNLHLIGVRREDGGKYYCEAENSISNSELRITELEIQETPQILKSLKNVNLEVGDNLTLACQVRGHPKPTLKWFHNGKEMVADYKKSHLVIPHVGYKHSGIYQCLATNVLGTTYEFAIVTVTSGNETASFEGRDEYDDYDSDDSHHHHKTPSSVDQDANEDSKFDTGRESSHSSKPYGRKRHKKKHSKGVKLIPPSKPDITRLSNTSVMVRWTVGNGGLPINFFKVQYKEVGKRKSDWMTIDEDIASHIHSYAVTGLRTGGAYRFRIAAVYSNHDNKAGPISTKYVLYKDPPMEKPSIGPIISFAEAVSPSAITLHWEYNDADSVTIEGFFIHYRATHTAGKYLKVTVLGSNTRSHIISHLLPDTGYDIKMQCFNIAGTSDFSNIYTSKTKISEVMTNARNRNSKSHQEEDDMVMSNLENDSSTAAGNSNSLFIIVGGVVGVLLICSVCCVCLFIRQRKSRRPHHDHVSERENHHKTGNGHISSNGYIPVANKININVNPLSHLNISTEKMEEMQDIVSNNNEIIRLQTFSANTVPHEEPLLTGTERESSMNENGKASSVISQSNSDSSSDLPTDL